MCNACDLCWHVICTQVAYHGAPEKAYEVFVSALRDRYLGNGLIIPSLGDHNPAGVFVCACECRMCVQSMVCLCVCVCIVSE